MLYHILFCNAHPLKDCPVELKPSQHRVIVHFWHTEALFWNSGPVGKEEETQSNPTNTVWCAISDSLQADVEQWNAL